MAMMIDPPTWAGHGRLWSHVASDTSLAELHAFAAANGIPERAFDRDHYDVPLEWYEAMVAAGARPVSPRVIVAALRAVGLRTPRVPASLRQAS
ncbi:MAG: DUF4031 domain-containing protein [Sporichthyaceae bacterium]